MARVLSILPLGAILVALLAPAPAPANGLDPSGADATCQMWSGVLDEIVAGYDARGPRADADRRIAPAALVDRRLFVALSVAVDGIYEADRDTLEMVESGQWIDACADAILMGMEVDTTP